MTCDRVALGRRVTPLSQARCQWNDSRSSGREKRLISKTIRSQIKSRFINPHNPLHTSAGKGGSREVDGKDPLLTGDLRSWECLPSFPCSVDSRKAVHSPVCEGRTFPNDLKTDRKVLRLQPARAEEPGRDPGAAGAQGPSLRAHDPWGNRRGRAAVLVRVGLPQRYPQPP